MRVLLEDGFSIEKGTGIGRYTQNLANALGKHEGVALSGPVTPEALARIRPVSVRRILYTAWLETGFQKRLVRLQPDIVHFTNHLAPRSRKSQARYVVTIHDLTAWRLPDALPPLYARYVRWALAQTIRAADLILCPSNSIRNEILEHFGVGPGRVRVVWHMHLTLPEVPVQKRDALMEQLSKRLGVRRPFLLFVGTLERRKNVSTLVDAVAKIAGTSNLQLVMVGKPGYGFSEIRASLERQAARDRFVVAGFLNDEELAVLYQLAELFVYPSRYEGFGAPLVEAMGFGLPIVASRIPSTEEVAGEVAAYYENPFDVRALAEKIAEVAGQPCLREEMANRAKIRAAAFTTVQIVEQNIGAYQAALNTAKDQQTTEIDR